MKRAIAAFGLIIPFVVGACAEKAAQAEIGEAPAQVQSSGDRLSLDEIRRATERFKDVNVALAEGYVPPPGNACESAEHMGRPAALGAMGIHYAHPELLGLSAVEPRVDGTGTHTDFRRPSVLIYEPQADGSLELVAVENLVFKAAWEAAGHREPPSLNEKSYDLMFDDPATAIDEAHMFTPHYDLHVWLYRENPNGVYAQFNPRVSCGKQASSHGH